MARVLIVDDNPDYADGFAAVLKLRSHEAQACSSGDECLTIFGDFKPDVVIVDLKPDSVELARKLKGQVPVILITDAEGDVDADESLFAYRLPKPVNVRQLLDLIARYRMLFTG